MTIICPNCNQPDANPKPFQKFCSTECRKDYQRKKRAGLVAKTPAPTITESDNTEQPMIPVVIGDTLLLEATNKSKCKNVMNFDISSAEAKKLVTRLETAISKSRVTGGIYVAGYWDEEKSQEVVFNVTIR